MMERGERRREKEREEKREKKEGERERMKRRRKEGRGKRKERAWGMWCVAGRAVISGRRGVTKTRCSHWVSCKDVSGKITVSPFRIQTNT